jgi:hypothetical protein
VTPAWISLEPPLPLSLPVDRRFDTGDESRGTDEQENDEDHCDSLQWFVNDVEPSHSKALSS